MGLNVDGMMLNDDGWTWLREMRSLWFAPSWTVVDEFKASLLLAEPTPENKHYKTIIDLQFSKKLKSNLYANSKIFAGCTHHPLA